MQAYRRRAATYGYHVGTATYGYHVGTAVYGFHVGTATYGYHVGTARELSLSTYILFIFIKASNQGYREK